MKTKQTVKAILLAPYYENSIYLPTETQENISNRGDTK